MQDPAEKIIIIGDGETAELAYEYFTYDSPHEVVAFCAEKRYLNKKDLFELPVVAFEELEGLFAPAKYKIFVAVSYTQLNRVRTRLYRQAKDKGYSAVSYVSSKAFVWRNAEIGENCFILEHNIIQYGVKIGNNVTMWGANHVGHRSIVGDNCFITGHVVISGYCEVGESCFLGANCCIGNNLKVAEDCVIGAGAVVLQETEMRKVYRGNPARASHIDSFMAFNVTES
jgi:sugar O-acyltransferase (sialic acid O-acetyltransferase NeuD family)